MKPFSLILCLVLVACSGPRAVSYVDEDEYDMILETEETINSISTPIEVAKPGSMVSFDEIENGSLKFPYTSFHVLFRRVGEKFGQVYFDIPEYNDLLPAGARGILWKIKSWAHEDGRNCAEFRGRVYWSWKSHSGPENMSGHVCEIDEVWTLLQK